jgi:CRP-like cAMP-binding protein
VVLAAAFLPRLTAIIAEGRACVSKDGKQLREMDTGESFGEIALLRRIPRTATVTALTRLEGWTLAREEFRPP